MMDKMPGGNTELAIMKAELQQTRTELADARETIKALEIQNINTTTGLLNFFITLSFNWVFRYGRI